MLNFLLPTFYILVFLFTRCHVDWMLVVLLNIQNIQNLGDKIFMVGKQHCAVLVIASRSQASKPLVWSKLFILNYFLR